MGRPYAEELATLGATYAWANTADVTELSQVVHALRGRPLIIVGSGGSLSVCHFAARLHETHARLAARVLTPLEFIRHPVPQAAGVLLLSASGSNRDILAAAAHAIYAEYTPVVGLCARAKTQLRDTLMAHRQAAVFEYAGPSKKDGFLATNSLILTAVLLARAYGIGLPPDLPALRRAQSITRDASTEAIAAQALHRPILIALAAGWAAAAAYDLESKWGECGFGSVTITDARNFAHGRHYGLSRRMEHSLVLGLLTHGDPGLVERTLERLPRKACTAVLRTPLAGEAGAIDLLVQVIQLTGAVGTRLGIDPGRPRVPRFGRVLYHSGIPRRLVADGDRDNSASSSVYGVGAPRRTQDLWIRRKVSSAVWELADESTRDLWRARCQAWVDAVESARIGGVVFDYDGTLCEVDERFGTPAAAVGDAIAQLIDGGLRIGVATGRGDSVLDALRAVVPQRVWPQVIVGMYNGAVLCRLGERPDFGRDQTEEIRRAREILEVSPILRMLAHLRVSTTQLTVHPHRPLPEGLLYRLVLEALSGQHRLAVDVFASDHTVDVIAHGVSKRRVIEAVRSAIVAPHQYSPSDLREPATTNDMPGIMTIGDQGQAFGNDEPFLAHLLGISVEHVSSVFDACWNVAPPGARRTTALLGYLDALRPDAAGVFTWSVARASRSRPPLLHAARPTGSSRRVES